MGDKVYTLVISVDLGCCRCRQAIRDYLCQLQRKQCNRIVTIEYDEKNNHVRVSGPFDPEQLKRQLLCKFPKIINGIDIKKPPPKDEKKENWLKECLETYEKIKKCTEKCKKECEEKCWTECEKKILCKCKCKCDCDCEKKPVCPWPPKPPVCPEPPKPPVRPWPPLVVCCPRPCPCFAPWSNSFRCCSCGVECSPGMCDSGWGSGPSPCGRPQWGNCESSQPPNIIFESTAPSCSIM